MPGMTRAIALEPREEGNLIANGGFEDGSSGWSVLSGSLLSVDDPVFEGSYAARVAVEGGANVLAMQPVALVPGGRYQLSGRVLIDAGDVQSLVLRSSWQDGSGVNTVRESAPIAATGGAYQEVSMAPSDVPCDAANARVWIVLQAAPAATDAHAYVDGLRLTGSPGSATCATLRPTASATSPPSPTRTPVPPPGASPTPSHGLLSDAIV